MNELLTDRQNRMLRCMHKLSDAAKASMLAYYTDRFGEGEAHEQDMMRHLTEAVTALGYRMEKRGETNNEA